MPNISESTETLNRIRREIIAVRDQIAAADYSGAIDAREIMRAMVRLGMLADSIELP